MSYDVIGSRFLRHYVIKFIFLRCLDHALKKYIKARDKGTYFFNPMANSTEIYTLSAQHDISKKQGRFWFATDFRVDINYDTVPRSFWDSKNILWAKGQLEECQDGRKHWQLVWCFNDSVRGGVAITRMGCSFIAYCISKKANDYVWKDASSLGRRFEIGQLPFKRNSKPDYQRVKDLVKVGDLDHPDIPPDMYLRMYGTFRKIAMDHMVAEGIEKEVVVYHGPTQVGKSYRAWFEAGQDAYPKTPTTKFWDGYRGQANVVIDEFYGQIDISHMLRWLDRHPCLVESKGSGTPLKAKKIWLTSNHHPKDWYPSASEFQLEALLRRLKITMMDSPWTPPMLESTRKEEDVIDLVTDSE